MICALINNKDELIKLKDYIDAICINTNYSIAYNKLSNQEVIDLINESYKLKKEVVLKIDMMPTNKDIKDIINFLNSLDTKDLYLLIGDFGLFYLLKDKYKTIYANSVLVTSEHNFNLYKTLGFSLIMPSLEVTFDDTSKLDKEYIFFKSFGFHQMMHSKRKLISTYYDFINKKELTCDSYMGHLIEEIRKDVYKIYENSDGTVIFRPHPVNYYEKFNILKEFKFIYLDSQFINFDIFFEVVRTYYNLFNDNINLSDATDLFNNLNITYENTFIQNSTIYQKESLK